ncbi:MAG: hypothetical protein JNN32_02790 [Flavobacteriales bacterium]|nr:hypothetical protein [Flavobacteriales bacterium]
MKGTVLFTALGVVIGAGLGWLYWNYFGCTNGCAITSSPVNSSLYGALMGGLVVNTFKREERKS